MRKGVKNGHFFGSNCEGMGQSEARAFEPFSAWLGGCCLAKLSPITYIFLNLFFNI
jgi:hypothetical protein